MTTNKKLSQILRQLKSLTKLQNGGEIDPNPPKKKGWFTPTYSDTPIAKAFRKNRELANQQLDSIRQESDKQMQRFKASQANNYLDYKERASTVKAQVKDPNSGKKITISVDAPNLKTIREKRELMQSLKKEVVNYSDVTTANKSIQNLENIRNRSNVRMNNLNRLESGGAASTGQAIGSAVGSMANMIVPGLGSILSPVLGMVGGAIGGGIDKRNAVQDNISKMTVNTNPYGMELGGMIQGRNDDLSFYKGRSHRDGGILVNQSGMPSYNPVAEVEDGETRWKVGKKGYIFSKKLKI